MLALERLVIGGVAALEFEPPGLLLSEREDYAELDPGLKLLCYAFSNFSNK
jgi:hypothetical protein